jgi:hypothetical protein
MKSVCLPYILLLGSDRSENYLLLQYILQYEYTEASLTDASNMGHTVWTELARELEDADPVAPQIINVFHYY